MDAELKNLPNAFRNATVSVKIEMTSDVNITPFVARQNVNAFLLHHMGNLVSAGEAALAVAGDQLRWKVPVSCAIAGRGMISVGDIAVDVDTGEILLDESTPSDVSALQNAIEAAWA